MKPTLHLLIMFLLFALPMVSFGQHPKAFHTVPPKYFINTKGTIQTPGGAPVGRISSEGAIFDAHGEKLGSVSSNKEIKDALGRVIGRFSETGLVFTRVGAKLGMITTDGTVKDAAGNTIVIVDAGHKDRAAAFLFFFL